MVSIVIVSHSAKLAAGVLELAREMGGSDVRLATAGGLDLPGQPLGTDAALVHAAIESVWSEAGVLVLMDLGSAILSAELALEMLSPERRDRVALCPAPLVEGAVAAVVQARLGAPLAAVAAEASRALTPKNTHLGHEPAASTPAPSLTADAELTLTVTNALGLHARPAARLAQTLGQFGVRATLTNLTTGTPPIDATSVVALSTADVRQGHRIWVQVAGAQASAALAAVQALADENFGDEAEPAPTPTPVSPLTLPEGAWRGQPAAPGLALGPVVLVRAPVLNIPTTPSTNPAAELAALSAAIAAVRASATRTAERLQAAGREAVAAIFAAHAHMVGDAALLEPAQAAIQHHQATAAQAYAQAAQQVAAQYAASPNDYLKARAADVTALGQQVVAHLLGVALPSLHLEQPGIVLAEDLTPADTAQLDPRTVLGLLTAQGGPTSHSAILARALGIPAVVGAGEVIWSLEPGAWLALDGAAGYALPNPDETTRAEFAVRMAAAAEAQRRAQVVSAQLAFTHDHHRIEVAANVGSVADARRAVEAGAEGVGLFRTEFLFLDRPTAPDEDEQYAAYRAVCEVLGERPVIIRTLDVGGDKPLPYIDMGAEANPFLGWRALRLCLARPDFFGQQLRAIVRVAAEFPVKIMFPMVATLDEYQRARALTQQAIQEVAGRGLPTPASLPTGIMVEIPAAALNANLFAREVDFFSLGTNDLTQYTLAAERGNTHVADLADALHPAVLQLIGRTAEAARAQGKWAGVCGELAGDPQATDLLIGLGVTELSMAAPAIPQAKQRVRATKLPDARAKAQHALTLDSAVAVRAALAAH